MLVEKIQIQQLGDERGSLGVIESERHVPFEVKRVYYIYGTKEGVERGFHAHKALQQFAVAVAGSCEMVLDDVGTTEVVTLDAPEFGVLIRPGIWHYMKNFSADCVLLVFADAHYDESDYIRSYEEFSKTTKL